MVNSAQDAATLSAIEVMTAWADGAGGGGATFALSRIEQILNEDGVDGLSKVTTGLINLAGKLLLLRERDDEVSPKDTLQAIALQIHQRDA